MFIYVQIFIFSHQLGSVQLLDIIKNSVNYVEQLNHQTQNESNRSSEAVDPVWKNAIADYVLPLCCINGPCLASLQCFSRYSRCVWSVGAQALWIESVF